VRTAARPAGRAASRTTSRADAIRRTREAVRWYRDALRRIRRDAYDPDQPRDEAGRWSAAAGALTVGRHVRELTMTGDASASHEAIRAVAPHVHEAIDAHLQAHPIAKVNARKLVAVNGVKVNGYYDWRTGQITFSHQAHNWEHDTSGPGEQRSVSSSAPTREGAAKAIFVHELGHHLHATTFEKSNPIIEHAFEYTTSPISKYAGTEPAEYFAESFAQYNRDPGVLERHDPVGHRMVKAVLEGMRKG